MHSRRSLTRAIAALGAVVAVCSAGAGYYYWRHHQPVAQPAPDVAVVLNGPATPEPAALVPTPVPTETPLPPSVYVKVPYTSQSPFDTWGRNDPHEEYCEAAAILMVGQYFRGDVRPRIPPAEADASMAQLVAYERKTFPGVLDLPLDDVGAVGTQFYNLDASVMPVDLGQIERSLAAGRPVIIPVMTHGAGGQKIAPFYGAVNVYHVIVLTGYDSTKNVLYTNDAGFVQGQNYAYTWSTLSSAIDAQAQRYGQGRVMLVFKPR